MGIRVLLVAVLLSVLMLTLLPSGAQAIPAVNLMTCRDVSIQNLGASGTQVNPVACGSDFPTSLPYIVLFMEFDRLDYRMPIAWQLHAPNDEVYARGRFTFDPPSPGMWRLYVWQILPIAASEKEIVEKNPQFRYRVIEVGAKPISEMPGEWRLQASVDRGSSAVARFTLRP